MRKLIVLPWIIFLSQIALSTLVYARSLDEIKKSKKIVVGMSKLDYQPFSITRLVRGKKIVTGLDVDLARSLAKHLNVSLEIKQTTKRHSGLKNQLLKDEVDLVISSYRTTLRRAEKIRFSNPYYFEKRIFVMSRKFNRLPQNTAKIKNKAARKVGLFSKTTYGAFLKSKYRLSYRIFDLKRFS